MMLSVTSANYLEEYIIHIEFNDGSNSDVDLHNVFHYDHRPIFQALQAIDQFKSFKVDHGTIVWENELDLAPEFLYFCAFKNDPSKQDTFKEWGYL